MSVRRKIATFLWFDDKAEEAANQYTSLFPNSRIVSVARYGEGDPGPGRGHDRHLRGRGPGVRRAQRGPSFKFTEAISLLVNCETQEEVGRLWTKLSAGGEESQCGWLKDRFGSSWQIIPTALFRMMQDPDPGRSERVMEAMLQMRKIDIARLKEAYHRE